MRLYNLVPTTFQPYPITATSWEPWLCPCTSGTAPRPPGCDGSSKMNFFFFFFKFIYLFLAVLGLRFCARTFSSCSKWGPLFIAVRGPLTIVASLVAEHRRQTRRLSSCGSRAQLLRGMWDLPRPGLEPAFPALAGRFSTTAPPGKPKMNFLRTKFRSSFFPIPITPQNVKKIHIFTSFSSSQRLS